MLGLTIRRLLIQVETNGGVFEADMAFSKGLNIIRANNTSGKSTCINALAYGLGLEAVLGPSRKRYFPKSLYEMITDSKLKKDNYFVSSSLVSLEVENQEGDIANLSRSVLDDTNKISVRLNDVTNDYFLGSSGTLGSNKSDRGFHHWLANFISWRLPKVVNQNDGETTLYLECIFPLFFIEQKRGWSEIQANTPNYGIRNVKRAATEFCLGIDSFEHEKKIANLRSKISVCESKWDQMRSVAENIADFNEVKLYQIADINDFKPEDNNIDFFYLEGQTEQQIGDRRIAASRLLSELTANVQRNKPSNEKLEGQLASLRSLRRQAAQLNESKEILHISVSDTKRKLLTLNHDLDQYKQLSLLKTVGSKLDAELNTEKCPICESDLFNTLGTRTEKRLPMTLEENIQFLNNQVAFYHEVKERNTNELIQIESRVRLVEAAASSEAEELVETRSDLDDLNGIVRAAMREKLKNEQELKEIDKLLHNLTDIRSRAIELRSQWSMHSNSLRILRRSDTKAGSLNTIRQLESLIRANIQKFGFDSSSVSSISISEQTLRPEQEGYDIVAETSASDYIRIIWGYTLALMELASNNPEVKHGGFVVFDEPRQHETNRFSFLSLVGKAAESASTGGQVIFATSHEHKELVEACSELDVNLMSFDDYILSLSS